jgi:hypothetical protein
MEQTVHSEAEPHAHQWVFASCHLHNVAMVILCGLKYHIEPYEDSMTGFKLDLNRAPAPYTLFEQGNRDVLRTLVEHPSLVKRIEFEHKEAVRTSSQTANIKKLILSRNLVKDLQKYSASYVGPACTLPGLATNNTKRQPRHSGSLLNEMLNCV